MFIQIAFGYTATLKEKIFGIFYKTNVIENIRSFEFDKSYVHFEIRKNGKVYPYSVLCSNVTSISKDNGENIPVNCDDLNIQNPTKIGKSETTNGRKQDIAALFNDSNTDKNLKIRDLFLRLPYQNFFFIYP